MAPLVVARVAPPNQEMQRTNDSVALWAPSFVRR
jgi:hypothetical protein